MAGMAGSVWIGILNISVLGGMNIFCFGLTLGGCYSSSSVSLISIRASSDLSTSSSDWNLLCFDLATSRSRELSIVGSVVVFAGPGISSIGGSGLCSTVNFESL